MKVSLIPKPEKSQVDLDVTVERSEFVPYIERAAKKLSASRPLPGFRPGKAPLKLVIEAFGTERLLREAMDAALPRFFVKAVIDHHVEAIDRPSITIQKLSLEDDFHFIATVAVVPEVSVADARQLKARRRQVNANDQEVERELTYLAKMRSTFLDVARPAQDGDTVIVDFLVAMNGETIKGGQGTYRPVHIGEGHFIPDFEQKIIGMAEGDERQFTVTFPADFPDQAYRGQQAQVTVKAHRVQKRIIPSLNDDFARHLGKFDSLDHLKRELKAGILQEKEQKEKERLRGELSAQLGQKSSFCPIPDLLIEREVDRRLEELVGLLSLQNKTLQDYLGESKKEQKTIRQEIRPAAEEHVKISLALRAFAQQQEVIVSEAEIEEKMTTYLKKMSSASKAQQEIEPQQLKDNMAANLRTQKALDRLEQLATITAEQPKITSETTDQTKNN